MDAALVNLTPFLLALAVPVIGPRLRKSLLAWGVTVILGALFVILLRTLGPITEGGAQIVTIPWVPGLRLSLSLYLDPLALLFGLLVTGIGALVALYAGYYFETIAELTRFYRLLLIFMGGMLGLLLSGNLLLIFIGWEITSITSFFLISFHGTDAAARRGALQALVITAGGGLALLAGLSLLGAIAGSFELADLLARRDVIQAHPALIPATLLIAIGCFAKSAQFPLHFWLPDAMTAPTPASAYLHSATMVKAGVYLLFRLYPILGDNAFWQGLLITIGLITMLLGAALALRQVDLKAALAYSTVSQLGAFVALIGLPHGEGLLAALLGVLAHALYKGALFLIAGAVDHATGTRDLRQLGGLRSELPVLAVIAAIAGLSMAGLPPLLGFVAKEGLLEAFVEGPNALAVAVITLSALFTVTMAAILVWDVFFRPSPAAPDHPLHVHAPGPGLALSPGVLALGSILGGLFLGPVVQPLVKPWLAGGYLTLWHGVNTPFLLSVAAIVGGLGVFSVRGVWRGWAFPTLPTGRDVYQGIVRGVEAIADRLLTSQNGKLRYYLAAIIISVILLMTTSGLTSLRYDVRPISFASSIDFLKAVLLVLTVGATFVSIIFRRHLLAALSLGIAGYSVGGLFLLEPAPDVALVQFLVETIGTVLVIIMLGRISAPERQDVIRNLWKQSARGIGRDVLISVIVGVGVGLFSLAAVLNRPTRDTITTWHIANAEKMVGATDIVAAIVTDFRGMDTVIEITVFGMAALGVLTLLATPEPGRTVQFTAARVVQRLRARGAIPREPTAAEKELQDPKIRREMEALMAERRVLSVMSTPLTRTVANLILPFIFLIAISHIAYGSGAPGDGFTAGVVSGLGVALWYVVFGYDDAKQKLAWLHPIRLIGAGIGVAILNAAVPLIVGQPFLVTTQFKDLWLPAGLHLTSTTFFETGIFLTVLGGSALILETIAHPLEVEAM